MLINSIGFKVGMVLVTCFPLLCLGSGACTEELPRVDTALPASSQVIGRADRLWQDEPAVKAAIADGVTTGVALSAGAVEMNPLANPSPLGLVALTAAKIGLVRYAADLPEGEKRLVMKTTTAAWGGAAVNNLLVLAAAPPPFPLLAGLAMAVIRMAPDGARSRRAGPHRRRAGARSGSDEPGGLHGAAAGRPGSGTGQLASAGPIQAPHACQASLAGATQGTEARRSIRRQWCR